MEVMTNLVLFRLKCEPNSKYESGILIRQGVEFRLIGECGNSLLKGSDYSYSDYDITQLTSNGFVRYKETLCLESISWDRNSDKFSPEDTVSFIKGRTYIIKERTEDYIILIDENFKHAKINYNRDTYHKFKQI